MKNPLNALLSLIGLGPPLIAKDIVLKEGECWRYSTRPGDEASFLVIRKVETLPKLGEVVFITVLGVKMKGPPVPAGVTVQNQIDIPIAGANLRSSLKKRVQKRIRNDDWQEAYRYWREAYDSGTGGIFKQSVSECVSSNEEAMNAGTKG